MDPSSTLSLNDRSIGGAKRPIRMLVCKKFVSVVDTNEERASVGKHMSLARKALTEGHGMGLMVQNLSPVDFHFICRDLEYEKSDGDAQSRLSTKQCPVSLEEKYGGVKTSTILVRLGKKRFGPLLESLVFSQKYIVASVLSNFGPHEQKSEKHEITLPFETAMTKVFCRFFVHVPPLHGMQDFLRVLCSRGEDVAVDLARSTMHCDLGERLGELQNANGTDHCYPSQSSSSRSPGTVFYYIVLTVLPCTKSKWTSSDYKKLGIYLTVTKKLVSGDNGKTDGLHLYYEYAAPVNPMDKASVATFFMKMGTNIVVPCNYAVRIGSHRSHHVKVFGFCMTVNMSQSTSPFERGGKTTKWTRSGSGLSETHQHGTEVHNEACHENAKVFDFDEATVGAKEMGFSVGTIPSFINVEVVTEFRKKLQNELLDIVPGATSLKEVYEANPIWYVGCGRLDGKQRVTLPSGMWFLGGNEEGEASHVLEIPFERIQSLLGKQTKIPADVEQLLHTYETTAGSDQVNTENTISDDDFQ